MKRTIVILLLAAFAAFAAFAAEEVTTLPTGTMPTSLPMVSSVEALESYAKEQVRQAAAYGGSNGIVLPGGRTWAQVSASDPDIRVIQNLLASEALSFRVANPTEWHYFGAYLMDSAGYLLFSGFNGFYLDHDSQGNWSVPKSAPNISLELVGEVPIYLPGVSNAYALVTDQNGQRYEWMRVENDRLFFPVSFAGLTTRGGSGQLVLTVGGDSEVFDLGSGNNIPTTSVESSVQASISGLIVLDDPIWVFSTDSELYQVKITSESVVNFYGTFEGEVATGVYIRPVGETQMYYPIQPGNWLPVQLWPGVFDIWFAYPVSGDSEPVGKG